MKNLLFFAFFLSSCATVDRINEENRINHCFRVCGHTANPLDSNDDRSCVCPPWLK